MKQPNRVWYLPLVLLALVPLGYRAVTWLRQGAQPVDPAMAQAGQELFKHEWTANDPLSPGGDGLGPVFNAASCVACHHQGGPGGGGGLKNNVTTFTVAATEPGTTTREGIVHSRAVKYRETLSHVHPELPAISQPALTQIVVIPGRNNSAAIVMPANVRLAQRNTPALFGAGLIDTLPDRDIITAEKKQRMRWGLASFNRDDVPVGRAPRLPDGRIGRFGWKGQTASLSDFVQAACANELGLGNPGQAQPVPLGKRDYRAPGLDLTLEQCDQLTSFVAALSRPVERAPDLGAPDAVAGKKVFETTGCAECHTPDVGNIQGIYSDLLLHRMSPDLGAAVAYYGPTQGVPPPESGDPNSGPLAAEWRTPPLWGVADSAPYMHDGRAPTLQEAIRLHGGQGAMAARRYERLPAAHQTQLIAFLKTLRAP